MAKKTTTVTVKRKPIARAIHCDAPGEFAKAVALNRLTTPELKRLLRAAGLGIPKTKSDMAERLATSPDVVVTVNVEAVVFSKPRFVKA